MNGTKIRMIREIRGFSQGHVADILGIAQTSYSRMENNHTKIDTELLGKLAQALGVTAIDILSAEPALINFSPNQAATVHNYSDHYSQKDLVDKIITLKDLEIAGLKETITRLREDKERLQKRA